MAQLAQGLGFNLANSLPCYVKVLPNLFKGVILDFIDPKAHAQHLFLSWSESSQGCPRQVSQICLRGRV